MTGFRKMAAKFSGKCALCGGAIAAGDEILWKKGAGARHADEADCGGGYTLYQEYAGAAYQRAYHDEDAWEAAEIRREEAEYQRGYHEVREIQAISAAGSAFREQLYREMEQAAYNRGEDY